MSFLLPPVDPEIAHRASDNLDHDVKTIDRASHHGMGVSMSAIRNNFNNKLTRKARLA